MKVILLRGLAASGKTTLMNKIGNDFPEYILWSKDTMFDELLSKGVEWEIANKETYKQLFKLIMKYKHTDNKLIIDAPYYREVEYLSLKDFCQDNNILFKSVLLTCSDKLEWKKRFKQRAIDPKSNQTITDYDEIKKYYGSMNVKLFMNELVFDSCQKTANQYQNLVGYIRSW